uniref:TIR domain-containing protein n=1 Tax=Paramoeba aestuarina TaxID=180227 RepID=A0A7S4L190_9EUKA
MTDETKYQAKTEELSARIKLLTAKQENFMKEVPKVDPANPTKGDGFELRITGGTLNFSKDFSTERTIYSKMENLKSMFTGGQEAIMEMSYWWPVTILSVKNEQVQVCLTGYENDPFKSCMWQNKSDLRLVKYPSSAEELKNLRVGVSSQKYEVRLFQKGGYAWVDCQIKELYEDGKVLVFIDSHARGKYAVDSVEVSRCQLRIVKNEELNGEGTLNLKNPSYFLSYCWRNSNDSYMKGEVPSCIGNADPRAIQAYLLKQADLLGWLDIQQLGRSGLFDDICAGLVKSRVVIACISDEYAKSENCCLEFEFAVKTMRIPVVPVIVGTGYEWKQTKIGFLIGDRDVIDLTLMGVNNNNNIFQEKIQEIARKVELLLEGGENENNGSAAFKSEVPLVDPKNPKVGEGFEILEMDNSLNFDEEFSQERTIYQKTGKFTDGKQAQLDVDYWWPVTIAEVKGKDILVNYTGYEDDKKWGQIWRRQNNLRAVKYSSPLPAVELALETNKKLEARLFQKGGYCWVPVRRAEKQTDGSVLVWFHTPKKPSKHDVDRVIVSPSQLRVISEEDEEEEEDAGEDESKISKLKLKSMNLKNRLHQ